MPNIASILKAEIARVARKEVRAEIEGLRKSANVYRSEIAALKKRTQLLEQQLRKVAKAVPEPAATPEDASQNTKMRFSAKGFATLRQRLGVSANDLGILIGTSGQSIYNWEAGDARPRTKYLSAIAALRSMGKKQVAAALAAAANRAK